MDKIEQTLERLTANWDQLHMNGTIDRETYDAGMDDFSKWIQERRAAANKLDTEYQKDWYEDRDGTYR